MAVPVVCAAKAFRQPEMATCSVAGTCQLTALSRWDNVLVDGRFHKHSVELWVTAFTPGRDRFVFTKHRTMSLLQGAWDCSNSSPQLSHESAGETTQVT